MGEQDLQRKQHIVDELRKSDKHKVKVAVTDIDGILRGKYLHKDKFLQAIDGGFGFCNVVFGWDAHDLCYDNSKYTGWHTGYPDAQVKVDTSTYRHVPWDGDIPFFLGDFITADAKPLEICPRQLLKLCIARLEKAGYSAKCGMEFEWFNFRETPHSLLEKKYVDPEPLTPGMFGYSLLRSSLNQPFFSAIMDELRLFQVPIEGLHTETGPGVYEAAILYSDPLEAADRGVLFKSAVREIAYRFQIMPSFMAKWNNKLPGCSGHIHQSLWNLGTDRNAFFEDGHPSKMSPVFRSYLAGLLLALPEILPFFAPTVNSYKRLVEGFWAPTRSTWGIDNRTTAFRVIPGGPKSTRLETRVSGSDVNPYLAISATLAAGLYGIENSLKLEDAAVVGSGYAAEHATRLPRNLEEATEKLEKSSIAKEIFGPAFVEHFVKTRLWEWKQFQESVTNWETQRYFEII